MSNPQQPELGRSRKTAFQDPDSIESRLGAQPQLEADAPPEVVPPENRPGHRPEADQDKPDLDAFAERLGVTGSTDGSDGAASSEARDRWQQNLLADAGTSRVKPKLLAVAAALVGVVAVLVGRKRRRSRAR